MVSQGVKQAIEDAGLPQQAASMNNVQHKDTLQDQLNKMKAMMTQSVNENQALQVSKTQQQNQQPFQNITNQQQPP